MKQTAVEWLCNEWSCIDQDFDLNLINKKIYWQKLKSVQEQAKAMEKEQIMEAREDGHLSTYAEYGSTPKCYLDGGHEEYYNETFKNK